MKRFLSIPLAVLVTAAALAAPGVAGAAQRIYIASDSTTASGLGGFLPAADGGIGAPIPGSAITAGGGLTGLAISPDGSSLYAAAQDDGVRGFRIAADGSLTQMPVIPTADRTFDVVVTPDGHYVYVGTFENSGHVYAFARAADGTLTPVDSGVSGLTRPAILAMAPDGRHLFVAGYGTGAGVRSFSIGPDGKLTLADTEATSGGSALVAAPDGAHLYEVTAAGTQTYSVAADGSLSAQGTPVSGGTGDATDAAVSPDGSHLYVSYYGNATIAVYRLGADGTPTQITGSPTPVGSGVLPGSVELNAAGTRLFVPDENLKQTAGFSVEADGLPVALPGSPFATGYAGGSRTIALTPDQGPTAALTTVVNNRRVSFNATGSTDPDGSINTYSWDFGDGTSSTGGDPRPTHRYGRGTKPPMTLTVSDESGCSTAYLADGSTPYCVGSPAARLTLTPFEPKFLGKPEQKVSPKVKLKLSCPVRCDVKVVGRVKLSGKGVRAKKTKLKGVTKQLEAGKPKTLKLAIPDRAVRLAKMSTRAVARLKVSVTDDAGDLFKERHGIRLK